MVGAPYDFVIGSDSGSAYVFEIERSQGGVWTQQAKLPADDWALDDEFRNCVSISGNTVVVGAYNDDDTGYNSNSGSAYVFDWSGGAWTQQAKLLADDADEHDNFRWCVSISGDTVVVSANQDDDKGIDSG